ncbi:MAG TPA: SDR family oxidoreductase, partial [Ktedonobacterales bacterium]
VFSAQHAGQRIRETDALDGQQEGLLIGYAQSKWVAEQLVLQAGARGLPVAIYRPGTITGHSQSGVWNTDDFLCRAIKGAIQLGSLPGTDEQLDLTPVDYVSRSIVALSLRTASWGMAYHLIHPSGLRLRELADFIRSLGYPLRSVSYPQWRGELLAAAQQSMDNALYPLVPLLADGTLESQLPLPAEAFDCRRAAEGLVGTNIVCPPVDAALLRTYVGYLQRSGFLPLPPDEATDAGADQQDDVKEDLAELAGEVGAPAQEGPLTTRPPRASRSALSARDDSDDR